MLFDCFSKIVQGDFISKVNGVVGNYFLDLIAKLSFEGSLRQDLMSISVSISSSITATLTVF